MWKPKEVAQLKKLAEEYQLDNHEITDKYTTRELALIYNGIGSDSFPLWLRETISILNPDLTPVALIHDVEWHESDGSVEGFNESNERFRTNGYKVANQKYGWYNPMRYLVRHKAAKFARLCQALGWHGWVSACECAVCKKKSGKKAK